MLKNLIIFSIFTFSFAQAQTEQGRPPTDQLNVTKMKSVTSKFVESTNSSITKCTGSVEAEHLNFLGIFKLLTTKVHDLSKKKDQEDKNCDQNAKVNPPDLKEIFSTLAKAQNTIDKKQLNEDKFFKCLLTKEFKNQVEEFVARKNFVKFMIVNEKVSRKQARQVQRFYRELIEATDAK
jgi:hypothetical protein